MAADTGKLLQKSKCGFLKNAVESSFKKNYETYL